MFPPSLSKVSSRSMGEAAASEESPLSWRARVTTGRVHGWSSLPSLHKRHWLVSCPVPLESVTGCKTLEWGPPLGLRQACVLQVFQSLSRSEENNYEGLQNSPFQVWFYLNFVWGTFTSVQCIWPLSCPLLLPSWWVPSSCPRRFSLFCDPLSLPRHVTVDL